MCNVHTHIRKQACGRTLTYGIINKWLEKKQETQRRRFSSKFRLMMSNFKAKNTRNLLSRKGRKRTFGYVHPAKT